MNKIKIISYNGISNAGGVERVAYYLNEILLNEGYSVEVIDEKYIKETKIYKFFKKWNIKVLKIFYPLILSFEFFFKNENPFIISNGYNLPFYKSNILFVHGTMKGFYNTTKLKKNLGDRILIFYEKIACKLAKNIICVSTNAKEEAIRYYCDEKVKYDILNNCINNDIFYVKENEKQNVLNIGFCGRLDENKGLSELLLLGQLIDGKDNIKFNIATNNSKNKNLFENLKNVNIEVGLKIDELNDFYNNNNIMFFPSYYEGFEMVTLEALACGIPIYGRNIGAISELKDQVSFIKVMSNDSQEWIKEMQILINQITFEDRINNSLYIKNEFGKEKYLKKLNEKLKHIIY